MRRPDVALPATAEHGPAARESLRIKCSGAAKNEERPRSESHKRLRTSCSANSDSAVSPTASAVANLLQISEQPCKGPQHVWLTEPDYDAFVADLKRSCFGGVSQAKYKELKKALDKLRLDIVRYEAQLKEARDAAAKSRAAQKKTEKQLQAYVEYVRKLRAVPAPQ
ncbi:hypothetical protein CVIRNUC_004287 [Coccomyxa viridis]|uniref:G9179 protein n=2 Tax=Coccomyxa viridis TaxID=1274662 RepID=A0ABP1G298_9CHLO|nr:hypothetical protein CVIRNUC_004287 [Coccomyxa viridis]